MKRQLNTATLLSVPMLFVGVLFLLPLAFAVAISFDLPNFSVRNYSRIVDVPVYTAVYLRTLRVAASVTVICLILGYPTAYFLSQLAPRARAVAVTLVGLPFMLSVLVRNYAWMTLLQDTGLINRVLLNLGLVEQPVRLMYNEFGVIIAMVNMLVPYVIFPVLSALLAIQPDLRTASASLGAPPFQTFVKVTLPLSAAGTAAGCLLTFIVALGFYITPAMLGGPNEMTISSLIAFNVKEVLNWPFAFSLATTLLGATVVLFFIYRVIVPTQGMGRPA
jgi:ABC-type spermidine/putrescine transport system permease subunit I